MTVIMDFTVSLNDFIATMGLLAMTGFIATIAGLVYLILFGGD